MRSNGSEPVSREIPRGYRRLALRCVLALCVCAVGGCSPSDVEKGTVCLRLGDYRMAAEFFAAELQRDPADYDARLGMGKALLQQAVAGEGDTVSWRRSLMHFEAARSIRGSAEITHLLSEVWSAYARSLLAGQDTVNALEALSRAIEYDPQSVEAINLASIVYYRIGERDKARMLFARAVAADSTNATAHFNLGMVRWHDGDIAGAHAHWLEALKRSPRDQDILYWFARAEKELREEGAP